jgi:hypothetical protein
MDKIAQKANSARSVRGGVFENKIEELLSAMLEKNYRGCSCSRR